MEADSKKGIGLKKSNFLLLAVGWLSAVTSIFAFPLMFGPLGMVMGILAARDGGRAGIMLIVFSVIFMGTGLILQENLADFFR